MWWILTNTRHTKLLCDCTLWPLEFCFISAAGGTICCHQKARSITYSVCIMPHTQPLLIGFHVYVTCDCNGYLDIVWRLWSLKLIMSIFFSDSSAGVDLVYVRMCHCFTTFSKDHTSRLYCWCVICFEHAYSFVSCLAKLSWFSVSDMTGSCGSLVCLFWTVMFEYELVVTMVKALA